MKLTLTKTATITIDIDRERARINKTFRGKYYKETRKRLHSLMDLIEAQKWKAAYKALEGKWWQGEDKKYEFSRLEFIGLVVAGDDLDTQKYAHFFSNGLDYYSLVFNVLHYPNNYKISQK